MSIEFSSFISQLFANPSLFIITALLINYYVILYTKKKIISLDDVKKQIAIKKEKIQEMNNLLGELNKI